MSSVKYELTTELQRMSPIVPQTRIPFLLRITMLILGTAVFVWGLQYKLSLYHRVSDAQSGNVAKLIQGEQKNEAAALARALTHPKPTLFEMEWTAAPYHSHVVIQRYQQPDMAVLPAVRYVPYVLFIRPPPQNA